MSRCALALFLCVAAAGACNAQELEPRAYSPSPVGTNFLVLAYGRMTGEVLFDPSLPFSDVEARLNAGIFGYARTFAAGSRQTSATLALPYVRGDVEGNVGEGRREAHRSGIGDTRLRLALNLVGNPAMTPAEFAKRTPETTLGASLIIVAPIGQYESRKLINIGTNRWALKPELGLVHPLGPWTFEAYAGVWLFEDNDAYYTGKSVREQDPIASVQAHVSYTFRPRLWLALDATYFEGGQTTLDGVPRDDKQANSRVGFALSLPLGARQSLKFSASKGATTRIGGDFTTFGVAWQSSWFD
jgi:hypothetical protein